MIELLDGPAQGERLIGQRTPSLIRIAIDLDGECRALCEPGMNPRLDEQLHTYRLAEEPHLWGGLKSLEGKGWGKYTHHEQRWKDDGPALDIANSEQWQQWALREWSLLDEDEKFRTPKP